MRLGSAVQSCLLLSLMATLILGAGCAKKSAQTDPGDVEHATHVEFTVKPGDSWQSISEDFFGTSAQAGRMAFDNGSTLEESPPIGDVIDVRILPDELDSVRRLADAREPYNAGVAFLNAEDYELAVESFEAALGRAPEFVDARYNLGLAQLKLGQPEKAASSLADVVSHRENDKDAHYALASAYFYQGDYEASLPELEAALGLDAGFLRARFTYALALERMGRNVDSRRAWMAYLELDDSSAWASEARTHLEALP